MSYSTVCDAEEAGRLKGTARSGKSQSGAEQEIFWSPADFSFDDKNDAVSLAKWNEEVANGNLYYIGVIEEFDSNDTEPTYYESANGNLRLKTANAKEGSPIQIGGMCLHTRCTYFFRCTERAIVLENL